LMTYGVARDLKVDVVIEADQFEVKC
jgi:hypothetical protein